MKNYLCGMTKEDIVNIFFIWIDTLNRWRRKYKKTGSIEPEKQEKFRLRKLIDIDLLDAVNKKPSSRIDEIEKIFSVSHQADQRLIKTSRRDTQEEKFFVSREK